MLTGRPGGRDGRRIGASLQVNPNGVQMAYLYWKCCSLAWWNKLFSYLTFHPEGLFSISLSTETKPFAGRAGPWKGITPNSRTGVKRRETGLSWRNDGGRERCVWPAHVSRFLAGLSLKHDFFSITSQELCSPLSCSKTFSLKFN